MTVDARKTIYYAQVSDEADNTSIDDVGMRIYRDASLLPGMRISSWGAKRK